MITQVPGGRSLTADYLTLLSRALVDWTVLEPVESRSLKGTTLTSQPDGSILASGPNPDYDTYTVTVKTHLKQITGFQLQALNDPSLPSGGPGRHTSGNFSMSFFAEYQSASGKRPRSVRLGEPRGGCSSIWYWPVVEPVGDGDEATLNLILKAERVPRANLGRFRLAATTFRDLDLLTSMQSTTHTAAGVAQTALATAELIDNDSAKALEYLQHAHNKRTGEPVANDLLRFWRTTRAGRLTRRVRTCFCNGDDRERRYGRGGSAPRHRQSFDGRPEVFSE